MATAEYMCLKKTWTRLGDAKFEICMKAVEVYYMYEITMDQKAHHHTDNEWGSRCISGPYCMFFFSSLVDFSILLTNI